jgi:cephalosporin-C deacetylase-like acetyl esterase
MNRRQFLQLASVPPLLASAPVSSLAAKMPPTRVQSRCVPGGSIRDYLTRAALGITRNALADCHSASAWRRLVPTRRRQFLEMMGLADLPELASRPSLNVTVTGVVERERYRIEKLYYESVPRLYVTANLYVPRGLSGRAPGVLYVCGHAQNQKVHYQAHPHRFAELGFVCLIVETIQLGEVAGYHHGCYREGWFHWYSRGYTSAGIELLNGVRGLDLLAQRPEVDRARLGVTGISGGGAATWWIAAADERVKAAAPVCGTATLFSHINDRTVDGHCDCMWWINLYRWDLADVGGLIAPRPLLIGSADRDGIFTIESIRQVHAQLARLYRKLGAADKLRLIETPGGHSYHERSRTGIFSWFARHLQGREVPPSQIGDLDDAPARQESAATLRVYVAGSPPANRTATIQDDLISLPAPPTVPTTDTLAAARQRVVAALREKTFGAFPASPPPLDTQIEYEFDDGDLIGYRFALTAEEGWRLHGMLWRRKTIALPAPAVVALRLPGEGRWDTRSLVLGLNAPWVKIEFAPRGTGDTAWGEDLNWHLRRACAWTGRTLASLRVWDVLRALQAIRHLPEVAGRPVGLTARGEMAAVALYAALLDGHARALLLESPPATQNAPSQKDGRGPALEMLYCLRITDLAQVAGLLFPTELVVAGDFPPTYEWAEELYRRLGAPERFRRVKELSQWKAT